MTDKGDRSIVDIAADMALIANLTEGWSDIEADHVEADRLLIEALKWLVADESAVVQGTVLNLIADFERTKKWYA